MNRLFKSSLILATISMLALGCGGSGLPGVPGVPGTGGDKVDPNACGGMNMNDATKSLKAFLQAAMTLEEAAVATSEQMGKVCMSMGESLGMTDLKGVPGEDCPKVAEAIKANLKVGLKAHNLTGPDQFMKFSLYEGIHFVDLIEQRRIRAPYTDRCFNKFKFSRGQLLRVCVAE